MNHLTKTRSRLRKLKELLKDKRNLLIVMQDNPDPDSIAAAVALRELAHRLGQISCSIAYGGTVGRAENRALVHYLELSLRPMVDVDISRFHLVALVDTQPGTGNNSLPNSLIPDIIIDHHPCRRSSRQAQFVDIRKDYGATATILLEYMREAAIMPDKHLATAIIYAIRSDTQDLGRQATQAEIQAIQYLYPLANLRMLSQIQRGRVQRDYFPILARALQSACVYGTCIISNLGDIETPDTIGEVADLLLRDDRALWTLCYGFCQGKMLLSIRTSQVGEQADKAMRHLVARRGTGGGHETMAGGQIPLLQRTESERGKLEGIIRHRFLKILHIGQCPVERLIAN